MLLRAWRGFVMVTDDIAFPGKHCVIHRLGYLQSLERLSYSGDLSFSPLLRLGRVLQSGADICIGHGWFSRRKSAWSLCRILEEGPRLTSFSLTLSFSLLERMLPGEMTLVIKNFGEKEVRQVSIAARVYYCDVSGAQQTSENTQLATRKSVIWLYHLSSGDFFAVI